MVQLKKTTHKDGLRGVMKVDDSGWDRTFLNLSSMMSEPFCKIWELSVLSLVAPLDPQKFDNCTTKTGEIALRTLFVLGGISAAVATLAAPVPILGAVFLLAVGSKVFRRIGFALQKDGYTHVQGRVPEMEIRNNQIKIMNWNVCGVFSGMSLDHGGVIHWRRQDGILKTIGSENPDVIGKNRFASGSNDPGG